MVPETTVVVGAPQRAASADQPMAHRNDGTVAARRKREQDRRAGNLYKPPPAHPRASPTTTIVRRHTLRLRARSKRIPKTAANGERVHRCNAAEKGSAGARPAEAAAVNCYRTPTACALTAVGTTSSIVSIHQSLDSLARAVSNRWPRTGVSTASVSTSRWYNVRRRAMSGRRGIWAAFTSASAFCLGFKEIVNKAPAVV